MEKRLSLSEELEKLANLKDKGVLSEEEFQREKEKFLGHHKEKAGKDSPAKEPSQPSIVIQQSTTNANQATAAAVAVNKNGCLGTVLKAIGAAVVLLLLLGFCASGENKKGEPKETQRQKSALQAVNQVMTDEEERHQELNDQERYEAMEAWGAEKEKEFKKSDAMLSEVWTDMNPDARSYLKKSQIAWNREKESVCEQAGKENGGTEAEIKGYKFKCLTEWTNKRIPELIASEKEMLPRVFAAQKAGLEKELQAEMDKLKTTAKAVPQEVANTLSASGDILDWLNNSEQKCKREEATQIDEKESELALLRCLINEVKEKRQELDGYKI